MTNHTEVINHIIEQRNLQAYLEIGIHNKEHNFYKINCAAKYSVDPNPEAKAEFVMTSDKFFSLVHNLYDLCFIDGLHHADQVRKDMENAMRQLNDGGFLVLHDTNPYSEHITHVPRDNGEWTGDVYKAITQLELGEDNFVTLPFDYGITIVRKHDLQFTKPAATWEEFNLNRISLLNIKNVHQVTAWLHY